LIHRAWHVYRRSKEYGSRGIRFRFSSMLPRRRFRAAISFSDHYSPPNDSYVKSRWRPSPRWRNLKTRCAPISCHDRSPHDTAQPSWPRLPRKESSSHAQRSGGFLSRPVHRLSDREATGAGADSCLASRIKRESRTTDRTRPLRQFRRPGHPLARAHGRRLGASRRIGALR
jgi:hypothetical protein